MFDIRKHSGEINDNRDLVAFLYILMRDDVTPGRIEEIMYRHIKEDEVIQTEYTNGWLAQYAQNIADRLENKNINKPEDLELGNKEK